MNQTTPGKRRWPSAIIALHWVMAIALTGMIIFGMTMVEAANIAASTGDWTLTVFGIPVFDAYQLHKSFGFVLFVLVLLRLGVRFRSNRYRPQVVGSNFERFAAHSVQVILYGVMIGMPISGWLMASASPLGIPTFVFGAFELPHPITADAELESIFKSIHKIIGWLLIGLVALHSAAALRHHFIKRDDVLKTILPVFKR